MRSLVAVGLLSGLVGAVGLFSLTLVSRHPCVEDSDINATIDASLELGEQLWRASCPVHEIDGACIELGPAVEAQPGALPTHCDPASTRHRIVVPRDARKKAAALAAFADVIDRLAWLPMTGGHPELRYDLGLAKLYEGDALREDALAIAFPKDLDVTHRLGAWLETRTAAREHAAAKYAEVLAGRETKTMIAASARNAQLAEDVADQLFTLEIPSSVRTGELAENKVDAYCDAMTAAAEPALATAVDMYVACFAKATELDWFSEWSTLCETALERLEPEQYPALNELRRRPGHDNPTSFGLTADNYANGLNDARRGALDEALRSFQAAIARDPSSVLPWIDAGLVTLEFRRYGFAKQLFARAVELAPTNYDALIGLGIAERGLRDLDGAEASYERARDSDPIRGDAYYNLGILYKDFRATLASGPDPVTALRRSLAMYERARELFTQFLDKTSRPSERNDAQAAIADCDKAMKQIAAYAVSHP